MEKKQLLALCASLLSVFLLLFAACKKERNNREKGYNLVTAYKNALGEPVTIQFGYRKMEAGKETAVFNTPGITVKVGQTYESSQFICRENCPPQTLIGILPPLYTRMIIGSKVKTDTNCVYYFSRDDVERKRCETDPANFFTASQWVETKNTSGDIIRREYVIDQADLAEAH